MNPSTAYLASTALGLLTLVAAFAAVTLRNPVHCGLSLALAFTGVAGLFIFLGAEFAGFIQILVYVGAVAVLIMFVILLTRPAGGETYRLTPLSPLRFGACLMVTVLPAVAAAEFAGRWQGMTAGGHASIFAAGTAVILALLLVRRMPTGSIAGLAVALAVFATLATAILGSPSLRGSEAGLMAQQAPVAAIGEFLVTTHLLPLLITGILLTAALLGGVLFAITEGDD